MKAKLAFDDTKIAFEHYVDKELRKTFWLFRLMGRSWLVKLGSRLTPWAIEAGLPVKGLVRQTIFGQFVGGETLEATAEVVGKMAASKVGVILDYGVEGREGEEAFAQACRQFVAVIDYAATHPGIPYISIKVTGFARFALLEKLNSLMQAEGGTLLLRYSAALDRLSAAEKAEWQQVQERMETICAAARKQGVGVLVDAEESWIQEPVDALTLLMMEAFNEQGPVVYHTIQLYRHDRLAFLKQCHAGAEAGNFFLGVKLVRGAYMEKERRRAAERACASPIHPAREATDRDFNEGVAFCMDRLHRIGVVVASHNEFSNLWAVRLLEEKGLPLHHPRVHFSQLFGMSDNITFNLAKAGCNVSKYLPFGPLEEVIPYLMRRARENTSVNGQTGRQLSLIQQEMKRRGL
jgi:proline dehydrogenase